MVEANLKGTACFWYVDIVDIISSFKQQSQFTGMNIKCQFIWKTRPGKIHKQTV